MGKKIGTIDRGDMKAIKDKLQGLNSLKAQLSKEVDVTSDNIRDEARSKFKNGALPLLQKRGEPTSGLISSISKKPLSNRKDNSAYEISAGGEGKKIMAYAEFGTRSRWINLAGIRSLFGGSGTSYAARFKGSDNPKNFTHLNARPYFYTTAFNEKKKMVKRLGNRIKTIIRK